MTAEFHWDDARIFLAIARAGTLSGAADKMNMGIATVSRRLDRLEQALNVPLFSRHQSGYRLTDDGEALLARAEALEYAGLSLSEADFVGWPETHQHLPAAQWITRTLRGRPCKVEANTLVAQVSAVSAGLGLGVLPHFMARASGLQCLQPEIGADQTLWLVMHSDLAGSRRVRVLADHLIALFADHQDRLAMP
ncbi:TPA: LysR family transcriptional regulator [Klebsiella pneumoniae]|nr:LysR family transcriptional regulator [Klebsiella pneumoniae]